MEKKTLKFLIASGIILILLIALPVFAIAFASPVPGYAHAPRIKDKYGNSLNWAGYAVTGSPGSVTDVKGSWIVPSVTCPGGSQYAAFWVGIDGYSDSTVEQTGTDSDCSSGSPTYYAWFEFYPKPMFRINTITVHPGDNVLAEVKYAGGNKFTIIINDATTGQKFSTSASINARRSSAEWITEAPWSGGILPLADFGTANYGLDYTAIGSTNYATVGGISDPIGSFGQNVQQITMVTSSGALKAQPSSLSTDGTSFNMTWYSAGP